MQKNIFKKIFMSFAMFACALSVGVVNDTKHSKVKAEDLTREDITFEFAGIYSGFDEKQILNKPEKYKIKDTKNNYYGTTETTFYVTNGVTFGHDSKQGISFPLDYHKGETFDLIFDYTDFTNGYLVDYAKIRVCLSKEVEGLTCETLIGGNSGGISYITSTSTNSINTINKGFNPPISGKAVFRFTVPETVADYTSLYVEEVWFKYYTKLPSYNVSFDYGDGRDVENHKVDTENSKVVPFEKEPTREGYVFAGWAKEDGTAYDYTVAVTDDTAVHAVWLAETTVGEAFDSSNVKMASMLAFGYSKTIADDESVTYHDFTNITLRVACTIPNLVAMKDLKEAGLIISYEMDIPHELDQFVISSLNPNSKKIENTKKESTFIVNIENIPLANCDDDFYFVPYAITTGDSIVCAKGIKVSVYSTLEDYEDNFDEYELTEEQIDIITALDDAITEAIVGE